MAGENENNELQTLQILVQFLNRVELKGQEVPAFKSGLIKPTISQNAINKFGKVQKYGKIEKETLVSAIRDFAPRVQKDAKYKPLKKAKQRIVKPIKPKPTKKEKPKYEGGKK